MAVSDKRTSLQFCSIVFRKKFYRAGHILFFFFFFFGNIQNHFKQKIKLSLGLHNLAQNCFCLFVFVFVFLTLTSLFSIQMKLVFITISVAFSFFFSNLFFSFHRYERTVGNGIKLFFVNIDTSA
jgi:hypothetical protein